VIEVNPRASRTVPYVSKATGIPLAKIAARLMTGRKLRELLPATCQRQGSRNRNALLREVAGLSLVKFAGVDTVLGPEMKSTGEVMGVAPPLARPLPRRSSRPGRCCPPAARSSSASTTTTSQAVVELARRYVDLGFRSWPPRARPTCWRKAGLIVERVFKVKEGRPNVVDLIKGDRIQLIVNTPRGQDTFFDEKAIRRAAVLARIPTITTIAAAQAAARELPPCSAADHGLRAAATADLSGQAAIASEDISQGATGQVQMRASTWSARNLGPGDLTTGQRCRIERSIGIVLEVRPLSVSPDADAVQPNSGKSPS
jgi:hypothetical protein